MLEVWEFGAQGERLPERRRVHPVWRAGALLLSVSQLLQQQGEGAPKGTGRGAAESGCGATAEHQRGAATEWRRNIAGRSR